jgi:hypothetical protein
MLKRNDSSNATQIQQSNIAFNLALKSQALFI